MQHNNNNNNVPRINPISNATRSYYLNLGQMQSSYSAQSFSSSHSVPIRQSPPPCPVPDLRQIQKNEMMLDMMMRQKERKRMAEMKMQQSDAKFRAQVAAKENHIQCKRYEAMNRTAFINGAPAREQHFQNGQFEVQAVESHDSSEFQSKIPLYVKRCEAGQATNKKCTCPNKNKKPCARNRIMPLPPCKKQKPTSCQSKIPVSTKRYVCATAAAAPKECGLVTPNQKENIEQFFDCQSNSRSSLYTNLDKNEDATAAATDSKSPTKDECQAEKNTLKYSLETAILDLYEGNFKTKPTAKRDEVEACNFLLDLIKERINNINCKDDADKNKNPSVRATKSCVCLRQFGVCECECEKPCLIDDEEDNCAGGGEIIDSETEKPQAPEDQCAEYIEELNKIAELLSDTDIRQSIAEDSTEARQSLTKDIPEASDECKCPQKRQSTEARQSLTKDSPEARQSTAKDSPEARQSLTKDIPEVSDECKCPQKRQSTEAKQSFTKDSPEAKQSTAKDSPEARQNLTKDTPEAREECKCPQKRQSKEARQSLTKDSPEARQSLTKDNPEASDECKCPQKRQSTEARQSLTKDSPEARKSLAEDSPEVRQSLTKVNTEASDECKCPQKRQSAEARQSLTKDTPEARQSIAENSPETRQSIAEDNTEVRQSIVEDSTEEARQSIAEDSPEAMSECECKCPKKRADETIEDKDTRKSKELNERRGTFGIFRRKSKEQSSEKRPSSELPMIITSKTEIIRVEETYVYEKIPDIKSKDEIIKRKSSKTASIKSKDEVFETKEELQSKSNEPHTLVPTANGSKWQLDDTQRLRGSQFGLVGSKKAQVVEEDQDQEQQEAENSYCLFGGKKSRQPFTADRTQRNKGKGLGIIAVHDESEDEKEFRQSFVGTSRRSIQARKSIEARRSLADTSTSQSIDPRKSMDTRKSIDPRLSVSARKSMDTSPKRRGSRKSTAEQLPIVESEINENVQKQSRKRYSFKNSKNSNPFSIDETQRTSGEPVGLLGTSAPDEYLYNEQQTTQAENKNVKAAEVKNQKSSNEREYVENTHKFDTKNDGEAQVLNKPQPFDFDGNQRSKGQELGIIAIKPEKREDMSLTTEEEEPEKVTEEAKVEEEKVEEVPKSNVTDDCACLNKVISKDVTRGFTPKPLQERNCNCMDCLPNKKAIELSEKRASSQDDSKPKKFCCRTQIEQKENYDEIQTNDDDIQAQKNDSRRSSKNSDNRKLDEPKITSTTEPSSIEKLPAKPCIEDETQLAFFKCLAEQIKGKRKRLSAECNKQVQNQLPTVGDQRNVVKQQPYIAVTDRRNVQNTYINRSTTYPWTNTQRNDCFTQSANNRILNQSQTQQYNMRNSCCNRATSPMMARDYMNQPNSQCTLMYAETSAYPRISITDTAANNMRNAGCNRSTCPSYMANEPINNRILNEPMEQLNMRSSSCNRATCPSYIANEPIRSRVLSGPTEQISTQNSSCCDRTSCTQTSNDNRDLNESREQLNAQTSCNRSTCPWVAKEPVERRSVADSKTTDDMSYLYENSSQVTGCNRSTCPYIENEPMRSSRNLNGSAEQVSAQNSNCCNRTSCTRTSNENRDLNESSEELYEQTSCNRSTCPWIAKEPTECQTMPDISENNSFSNKSREQLNAQASCNRSTCPWIAKDPIDCQAMPAIAENTRVSHESREQLPAQTSCCNRSTCPWIAKDPIDCQTMPDIAENTTVSHASREQLPAQTSCCNRSTCPWIAREPIECQTMPDIAENTRVPNESREQLTAQASCCNRSTCPWITREPIECQSMPDTVEDPRLSNESREQLTAQTSCCNRSTCPWIAREPIECQTMPDTVEDPRLSNESREQLSAQTSCCNRSTCPWIAREPIECQTMPDTVEDPRVSNESREQLTAQISCCNRSTCPWIVKETMPDIAESTRISKESREQLPAQTSCCNRSTCPWMVKEPIPDIAENTRISKESREQLPAQTSSCNRSTCPWIVKEPIPDIVENTRTSKESREQLPAQTSCCNRSTCPAIAKEPKESQMIADTVEDTSVLNKQTSGCNRSTCPWIAKNEPREPQMIADTANDPCKSVEDLNTESSCCNRSTCPKTPCYESSTDKIDCCKRKHCSFAEKLYETCSFQGEASSNIDLSTKDPQSPTQLSPNGSAESKSGMLEDYNGNRSNFKFFEKGSSETTILNENELPQEIDSSLEQPKEPPMEETALLDTTGVDDVAKNTQQQQSEVVPKKPENCNLYCSEIPALECSRSIDSMKRNSQIICDIPPTHVPFFSDMYVTQEERQWNANCTTIQEDYFSCISNSSTSSSGSSACSSNGGMRTARQLRQEQESCCRCLKCLSASFYQESMTNFNRPQSPDRACTQRRRSYANSMCQTERNADISCCLNGGERQATKRRSSDSVEIVSAGHGYNPNFRDNKRRRLQKK